MSDAAVVVAVVGFFALAGAYVRLCAAILGPEELAHVAVEALAPEDGVVFR